MPLTDHLYRLTFMLTGGCVALAYVCFEDDPSRRGLVNRLSGADAKTVAQTIARAMTAAAPHSCRIHRVARIVMEYAA